MVTVTVQPGIIITNIKPRGKHLHVDLINYTGGNVLIEQIEVGWPGSNGNLVKIRLDGGEVWDGILAAPEVDERHLFMAGTEGWVGNATALTLNQLNNETMRLEFDKKAAKTGYVVRLSFSNGSFMEFTL